MNAMDEQELLQRAQEGDHYAFNCLVWKYEQSVYNIALRMLGSEEDALDVCQEVFLKVYQNLKRFEKRSAFYTWLYKIAVNTCLTELRKRKRAQLIRKKAEKGQQDDVAFADRFAFSVPQEYEQSRVYTRVFEALQELDPDHRVVVELRILQELSVSEVAQILGIPPGTVKSRLFYALKKLRNLLKHDLHEQTLAYEPQQ